VAIRWMPAMQALQSLLTGAGIRCRNPARA